MPIFCCLHCETTLNQSQDDWIGRFCPTLPWWMIIAFFFLSKHRHSTSYAADERADERQFFCCFPQKVRKNGVRKILLGIVERLKSRQSKDGAAKAHRHLRHRMLEPLHVTWQ